jgi:hypothetical protein
MGKQFFKYGSSNFGILFGIHGHELNLLWEGACQADNVLLILVQGSP